MRFTMVTVGTRGDVAPFVALGRGLAAAGHEVTIATHSNFEDLAVGHGLGFTPVATDISEMLQGDSGVDWLRSGTNPIEFSRGLVAMVRPMMRQLSEDVWQACQGTEAIVHTPIAMAALMVAEQLQVPSVLATLQPVTRTGQHPAVASPQGLRLGPLFNRLTHHLFEQFMWQPWRSDFNRWRVEQLSLPPLPFLGPSKIIYQRKIPLLAAYSSVIAPRPTDWPEWHRVTGYWVLENQGGQEPSAELRDFVESDTPPVYIGFGSMTVPNPAEFTSMVVRAVEQAGRRAVITSGWGALELRDSNDQFLFVEEAPHDYLLPRVAVAVHHGGAGTVAAGLRAGVPQMVVPFFFDQAFWGGRIAALGIGPRPVSQRKLTADGLAAALSQALADEPTARAQRMMQLVLQENGVANAARTIESYLAQQVR